MTSAVSRQVLQSKGSPGRGGRPGAPVRPPAPTLVPTYQGPVWSLCFPARAGGEEGEGHRGVIGPRKQWSSDRGHGIAQETPWAEAAVAALPTAWPQAPLSPLCWSSSHPRGQFLSEVAPHAPAALLRPVGRKGRGRSRRPFAAKGGPHLRQELGPRLQGGWKGCLSFPGARGPSRGGAGAGRMDLDRPSLCHSNQRVAVGPALKVAVGRVKASTRPARFTRLCTGSGGRWPRARRSSAWLVGTDGGGVQAWPP